MTTIKEVVMNYKRYQDSLLNYLETNQKRSIYEIAQELQKAGADDYETDGILNDIERMKSIVKIVERLSEFYPGMYL